ncbi:MAG: signal peptidase II [Candidatus Latescibacterota bacterium]
MRSRLPYGIFFFFLVLLDQVTKLAVAAHFQLGESREIFGNVLRLTFVKNPGGAFSVYLGSYHVMFAVTIGVIALLVFMFVKGIIRPETVAGKIALTMVFAGAVGNFIDRVRMREVIDFLDMGIGFHRWPVYNVADIAITIGMILLFITYSRQGSQAETENVSAKLSA